jgi:hypothetical protein
MSKVLRIIVVVCFLITSIVFSFSYFRESNEFDRTVPVITMAKDTLVVSVKDSNEKLLEGVTAFDEKDGDLTDDVIVESVSRFVDDGVCKVTYAVCDSNNHVANATRKVVYHDYHPPVFSLSKSLCYSLYEQVDIKSALHVTDCFDGTLDDSMVITSPNYVNSAEGVYTIEATVTNSKGDVSSVSLPMVVENRGFSAPTIELKEYLVYMDRGEVLYPKEFISSATDIDGVNLKHKVKIDTNINFNKEGTYMVHYYATDKSGNRGHSVMIVIIGNGNNER